VARGVVKPFMNGQFHPGGITVDRNMNVVDRAGSAQTTLWALGTLVEGCKFYTFVLPRPGANSTTMVDAGRAVGRMMDVIAERQRIARTPGPEPAPAVEAEPPAPMLVAPPSLGFEAAPPARLRRPESDADLRALVRN
jgi:hypothetical protein